MSHFIQMLAFQSAVIELWHKEAEDLQRVADDYNEELDDKDEEIYRLENELQEQKEAEGQALKEMLVLLKDVAKPGEYGSFEQAAWEFYHRWRER
jgi:hypothetical protein